MSWRITAEPKDLAINQPPTPCSYRTGGRGPSHQQEKKKKEKKRTERTCCAITDAYVRLNELWTHSLYYSIPGPLLVFFFFSFYFITAENTSIGPWSLVKRRPGRLVAHLIVL